MALCTLVILNHNYITGLSRTYTLISRTFQHLHDLQDLIISELTVRNICVTLVEIHSLVQELVHTQDLAIDI